MVMYILVATGSVHGAREWARERLVYLAANMGYRLENLYVQGRHYTDADVVRGLVNMKRGDPLFAFDPDTARDLLKKISWVGQVEVRRELPSTIYITLNERSPVALWQHDGKVRVVDPSGVVLTTDIRAFSKLPLVVGAGANLRIGALLTQVAAEPEVEKRLEAATWIGNRRWDLLLKGGMTVKLPEDDVGLALRKLGDGQRRDHLLEKDIVQIDLREADRLVIRTRPGLTQDYRASFKPGGREL
jgi:cell division protein FtsQ